MRLIPNYIDEKNSSNAEKKLFKLFSKTDRLNDWVCLHSLGVSQHINKREGEIDFLLIGPAGIFALEVKGGRVERRNGIWYFTDRFSRVSKKHESPFTQAKTALYSIRSDVTERFGKTLYSSVFGYGAMFPDIQFGVESPEWHADMVFDHNDMQSDIADYVERLSEYWTLQQRSRRQLTRREISEVVNYLRGDFEIIRPLSETIEETEDSIIRLTEEQYTCLDAMELNPRTIFFGAAGTGKTLLAVEKARRNKIKGIPTLFLCFNRLLADYVNDLLSREPGSGVQVYSLHSFLNKLIKQADLEGGLNTGVSSQSELYERIYPHLALQIKELPKFEELIIDEAQDVLSEQYLKVLDRLVDGGVDHGKWLMCMDPENQDIYQKADSKMLGDVKSLASSYVLTINCRNTKPIAIQTELITGISAGATTRIEGVPVNYIWYEDQQDQARQLSDKINVMLKEGVEPDDITILSHKSGTPSLAGSGRLRIDAPTHLIDTRSGSIKINGHIGYCTISSFKGLESKVIVITDTAELEGDAYRLLNYVGFTRARALLVVCMNKELKKQYKAKIAKLTIADGKL